MTARADVTVGAVGDAPRAEELEARLELMAARLDEQAAVIARLAAASLAPVPAAQIGPAQIGPAQTVPALKLGRRDLLGRMLGATAAVGALTLARDAAPAHADVRGTVLTGVGTTVNYGLAATDGSGDDPLSYLPNLSGLAYGVVGTRGAPGFRPPRSAGVLGSGFDSGGVVGVSQVDVGVYGQSVSGVGTIGTSENGAGVYGYAVTAPAVFGTSPNNVGVFGQGTRNAGVFGASPVYGVWGRTVTGLGVHGEATGAGVGVFGRAPIGGGWAGYFDGNLFVTGRIFQGGATAPGAAMVAPAEDVGRAKLSRGRATVTLDAELAAALGDDYHVFLTENGESNGLYVSSRGPAGFEVRERQGGTSSLAFSYQVVAARRGSPDARSERARRPVLVDRVDVPVPTPPASPTEQANDRPKPERR